MGDVVQFDPAVGEDENGWISCTIGNKKGLIPASYLQIEGGGNEGVVADTIHYVVALFDYVASEDSEDELSISEGNVLEVTALGTDVGEGWIEVMKDGIVGIVPSSYVEPI